MESKQKIITWNFIFFVLVSFYCMGAGLVGSVVNYPVWHLLGSSDIWIPYHKAMTSTVIPMLAVPVLLLQLISNVLLFFFRPFFIPKGAVWTAFILLLIVIISSAVIQIPIQAKLDTGYSRELVDRLIVTDMILRVWVSVIRTGVVIYMMYCLLKTVHISNKKFNEQIKNRYNAGATV